MSSSHVFDQLSTHNRGRKERREFQTQLAWRGTPVVPPITPSSSGTQGQGSPSQPGTQGYGSSSGRSYPGTFSF
jgi:hypothetical protein